MDGGQGRQGELTPGQQVLNSLPTGGPPRSYAMNSTNKHKVSRGRYLTSNDPRGYIPVYEYPVGDQWIMLDAEDGYVLWTAIWKALGNAKADVVRMLDNMPELSPHIRRVRGGYLKIQGTWMKYEIAEDFARRVAYNIREDLIPLFGPNFPASCLTPDQAGYGNILPGGRRRKARTTTRKPSSSKASEPYPNEEYHPGQASAPGVGMTYPDAPPSQAYTSNERASYGAPGSLQPYPGSPSQPVPHFTQAPMYASQQQQHYPPPHGQQYYDQMPPPSSDLQQQHQNFHSHPEYTQQQQQQPLGASYYQAGIPSSSGPTRSSSSNPANTARQHPPSQLRYDPYGAAAKAHHGGRPVGGGEQQWSGGVPTYGRLPQVDYSRVHLSPGGSTWGAITGGGSGGGGRQPILPGNNGVGRGPVVDPSLVGSSGVPVPPSSDRGHSNVSVDKSGGSRGEGSAENGDNDGPIKSSNERNTPQSDNNNGDSRPPSYGSHSHSSGKQSLGLPISSARDDAGS